MDDDGGWHRTGLRRIYKTPWFGVRQDEITLPSGERISYGVIEHAGYAVIVPVWDDGRVVIERIFRWPLRRTILELPSGGFDGEEPERAARRELLEETGIEARTWTFLGRYDASSGISEEHFQIFLAQDLVDTGRVEHEATEQIEIETIPLREAFEMALSGEVGDGPSALALVLAARKLGVAG
ncbi:MAG: NUDIX hydrolase [Myxococcota bacterium]|nr:NUDIX hydrolase [Myxococcota bacterium]